MKKIRINREDLTFHVPPEAAGQTVEIAYAMTDDGDVVRRWRDTSDRSETAEMFLSPDDEFSPWNGSPRLGRKIADVILVGEEEGE